MKAEVTRLVYSTKAGSTVNYIDLFRGLCLANGRDYNQFKNGDPLMVMGTIRLNAAGESVEAIKPTWAVKNALNKANDAWTRTLRSAGLKKSQLNTYGKELRVAWDKSHSDVFCAYDANKSLTDAIPDDVEVLYKSGQYDSGGLEYFVNAQLTVETAAGVGWGASPSGLPDRFNVRAFDNTRAAVPLSGSVDVQDKFFGVYGDVGVSADYLPILNTYLDSRINETRVEDTDMDDIPTADNDFVMMLAPGEEVADDVIDNVREEGRWRPYTTESSAKSHDIIVGGANVAGQDTSFHAPLGLLKWTPASGTSKLVIDVLAITEM